MRANWYLSFSRAVSYRTESARMYVCRQYRAMSVHQNCANHQIGFIQRLTPWYFRRFAPSAAHTIIIIIKKLFHYYSSLPYLFSSSSLLLSSWSLSDLSSLWSTWVVGRGQVKGAICPKGGASQSMTAAWRRQLLWRIVLCEWREHHRPST